MSIAGHGLTHKNRGILDSNWQYFFLNIRLLLVLLSIGVRRACYYVNITETINATWQGQRARVSIATRFPFPDWRLNWGIACFKVNHVNYTVQKGTNYLENKWAMLIVKILVAGNAVDFKTVQQRPKTEPKPDSVAESTKPFLITFLPPVPHKKELYIRLYKTHKFSVRSPAYLIIW